MACFGSDRQFPNFVGAFDLSALAPPPPPDTVKSWPLIGNSIYQFWDLASTNLQAALAKIAPQFKPLGSTMLHIAAEAGTGAIKFFIAIFVAGFLFSPAPALAEFNQNVFTQTRFGAR